MFSITKASIEAAYYRQEIAACSNFEGADMCSSPQDIALSFQRASRRIRLCVSTQRCRVFYPERIEP
jgi:hypothetical protein